MKISISLIKAHFNVKPIQVFADKCGGVDCLKFNESAKHNLKICVVCNIFCTECFN